MAQFFTDYYAHIEERAKDGIPPLALTKEQTAEVIELLKNPPSGKEAELVELITNRVNPGVDPAAQVKADFLFKVARGEETTPLITAERAVELLGTMIGGYNLDGLILLVEEQGELAEIAATALCLYPRRHSAALHLHGRYPFPEWAAGNWRTERKNQPAGYLRRRRGWNRIIAQIGLQLDDLAHRKRHPVCPEQTPRRNGDRKHHCSNFL